jgi:hypothetical protein
LSGCPPDEVSRSRCAGLACVCGRGLQPGDALGIVHFSVVTLQTSSTASAVEGCCLVGCGVVSKQPLHSCNVAGVSNRVCVCLGPGEDRTILLNSVPQWGAESSLAGQWLPAAVWDGAWLVRTGSRLMLMCCDIFAAARLWRGCLLTTGHLSSSHPVVVGAGDVLWGLYGGGAEAWAYSGSCDAICVRVFSSVSHL